jgi:hypothetical protein
MQEFSKAELHCFYVNYGNDQVSLTASPPCTCGGGGAERRRSHLHPLLRQPFVLVTVVVCVALHRWLLLRNLHPVVVNLPHHQVGGTGVERDATEAGGALVEPVLLHPPLRQLAAAVVVGEPGPDRVRLPVGAGVPLVAAVAVPPTASRHVSGVPAGGARHRRGGRRGEEVAPNRVVDAGRTCRGWPGCSSGTGAPRAAWSRRRRPRRRRP